MNHDEHRQIKSRINLISDAEKWDRGYDLTGEGLHHLVPKGHIRILETQVQFYRKGGYTVLRQALSIPDGDRTKQVTLILVDLTSASHIPSGYLNPQREPRRGKRDATRSGRSKRMFAARTDNALAG